MAQLWYKKGSALLEDSDKKQAKLEDLGWEVIPNPISKEKSVETPKKVVETPKAKPKKVRARDEKGHFKKDNPDTPENEAWEDVKEEKPSDEIKE